jgi:subtilisin family serine protease
MLRRIACGLLVVTALLGSVSTSGADTAGNRRATGERRYIVVYRDAASRTGAKTAALQRRLGFEVDYSYSAALRGFAADLTRTQLDAVRDDTDVAFVNDNRVAHATAMVPLAPGEPLPPTGVRRIRTSTRTTTREASSSNVAVIDTGIRLSHPDLNVVGGTDCIDPGTPPSDVFGHGTHIAGTIGALNNGSGVVGVAPGTKLFSVRVLGDNGDGSFAAIICGIDWVTAHHASRNIDVANMSLGAIDYPDPRQPCATTTSALHKAICNSTAAGVTYVTGAGNDTSYFDDPNYPTVPAAYPEVLTVTAVYDSDGRPGALGEQTCWPYGSDDGSATFSNLTWADSPGVAHTIAAPGVCINSTWFKPPFYRVESGTSVASPHVAGLVALCMGEVTSVPGPCAGKTPAEVIGLMRDKASRYAYAHPDNGFVGDPLSDVWPRYYGFLARPFPPAPAP